MAGYSDRPGERASYRVGADAAEADLERRRLALLGELRDRRSAALVERLGLAPGWRCLDVGSGGGAFARWLAERVAPAGSVLATDVDLRFQPPSQGRLEVRRHDVVADPLPDAAFELIHVRGVLQTVEQREAVLDKLVRALAPGGWLVVGDPDFGPFEAQELPEAFRRLYDAMMAIAKRRNGYDPYWGRRILPALAARGLEAVDCEGQSVVMRGGTPSAEWLLLAYERAAPGLVAAGLLDAGTLAAGLAAARSAGFQVMGPLSMLGCGRRPRAAAAR